MNQKFALGILLATSLVTGANVMAYDDIWKTETLELDASDLQILQIDAGAGDIDVTGIDDLDEVRVIAHFGGSEVDESDYTLTLESRRNSAQISVFVDSGWNSNTYIDIEVHFPKEMMLEINDRSGDISIANVNNSVEIDDRSGDVSVENVNGNLIIEDNSGDLSLRNINGAVNVEDKSGDVVIVKVTGAVKVEDNSGDITLRDIGGNINVRDSSGDIDVRDAQGVVDVTDTRGDVDVDGALDFHINKSGSGDVDSRNIGGKG